MGSLRWWANQNSSCWREGRVMERMGCGWVERRQNISPPPSDFSIFVLCSRYYRGLDGDHHGIQGRCD
ncbi:hypothetical protein CEXT_160021 [Caerostris extrusa]|uniref:Uncharacterized protein n=1 Tax=Caerostris extrusa TaxID=172846 RepID=A0AAV4NE15_CAEEX|nr:hypothetical protein CEXT_160021 [Caerostris extrusa]